MSGRADDRGPDEPMPDLETFTRLIESSPDHEQLADLEQVERLLFSQFAGHEDPMWREIGQQLRDGQMSVRRLLDVDAYWEHLRRELAERRDEFRRAVASTKSELEAAQARRREPDETT